MGKSDINNTTGNRENHKHLVQLLKLCEESNDRSWGSSFDAFDRLLEFMCLDIHGVMMANYVPGLEWWLSDDGLKLAKEITDAGWLDLLPKMRDEMHDHLGEIYMVIQSHSAASAKGQFLTPQEVSDLMAMMTIDKKEGPINVLDPCIGTGRMAIAAAKVNPDVRFYGVDIDLRATQVTFINCSIMKIHGFILHADSLCHVTDLEFQEGHDNWQLANKWTSRWDELKKYEKLMHKRVPEGIIRVSGDEDDTRIRRFELIDPTDPDQVNKRRQEIDAAYSPGGIIGK